ncbi:putative aldouronate transport system permease protein [Paenibacillus sp. UNCCL117]|uniref:ABC transporter permease n=1 Tax=unclassified Paenibacillus TaxID=185978 RepID=UPI0008916E26|nr:MULTISPECIES: ABC transporter permease subunit [unclassified Paenibacillus]SDD14515.1 putative aldouronate transport system permease protein [Paenibacillus sp. cl123]SFW34239.1 putative aldouronate transport system permease protein [Paenibacillus sp. UNCCL117]
MNHVAPLANDPVKKRDSWAAAFKKGWARSKYLHLLALPGVLYYLIFNYVPMYGILIAFQDFQPLKGVWGSTWIGFDQFKAFFQHMYFWRVIRNTLLLSFLELLFVFPLQILFAIFLNEIRNRFYKRFVQTVSYLPHFISLPAIVGMLFMFLSPQDGPFNMLLVKVFHMEPINFMGQSEWFRPLYILSDIWTTLGWGAIIYLAALTNVNPDMYESASLDGASRVQMIWHITLPAIQPTIMIMLLLQIGKMMSLGADKVLLMQSPVTYEVSDVISTFVYRRGLEFGEFSFATAVGFFNSLINIFLLLTANWIVKKTTDNSLF